MNKVIIQQSTSTTSLLGIAFVVLKLTHCIDWSWLWVLSPFWLPLAFLVTLGVFLLFCAFVCILVGAFLDFLGSK